MKIPLKESIHSTKEERLKWEKELLGLYVTDHPMTEFASYLKETATEIGHLEKEPDGKHVSIGGVITSARKSLSKTGQPLYFVTLEDMTGRVDLLVFGKTAERVAGLMVEDEIVMADLKITRKDGLLRLAADDVRRLNREVVTDYARVAKTREKYQQKKEVVAPKEYLVIHCADTADSKLFDEIGKTLRHLPTGPMSVTLKLLGQTIATSFSVEKSEATIAALSALPGVTSIETTEKVSS